MSTNVTQGSVVNLGERVLLSIYTSAMIEDFVFLEDTRMFVRVCEPYNIHGWVASFLTLAIVVRM